MKLLDIKPFHLTNKQANYIINNNLKKKYIRKHENFFMYGGDPYGNIKKYFELNNNKYNQSNTMGKSIDGMMSMDEHKVVLTHLQHILNNNIEGDIVEFGCYQGNTTVAMQRLLDLNNSNKKIYVYDSFEGLPDNNINDSVDSDTATYTSHKGSMACSVEKYKKNIENNKCKMPVINKGFFSDIPHNKVPSKICFAFYDGDLYQSTLDFLDKVNNKMVKGSIIVFDDFVHPNNLFPGTKRACTKYFKSNNVVKFVGNTNLLDINDDFYKVPKDTVSQGVYFI